MNKKTLALALMAFANFSFAQQNFMFSDIARCNEEFEPYFQNRAIASGSVVGRNLLDCFGGKKYDPPLIISISTQDIEMVEILLKHGVNPNLSYREGWTPLQESKRLGNKELIDLLVRYGAK